MSCIVYLFSLAYGVCSCNFFMRDWSFTWLLILWMSCIYSLTQHPFSKSACSGFTGVCLSPCGPHTGPQNLYRDVERFLSIIAAKSVIIYTPNNNKSGSCPRNKFSWLLTHCWMVWWALPCPASPYPTVNGQRELLHHHPPSPSDTYLEM